MGKEKTNLIEALGLRENENVAIVGGGGKTSLMFRIAKLVRLRGRKVITTTTTKVWRKEAENAPELCLINDDSLWQEKIRKGLEKFGHIFVGRTSLSSGKVDGIDPEIIDNFYRKSLADYIVVEADGAAGRPVKVPAGNEPIIPRTTTSVIGVLGADAIGKPFESRWVFREQEFEELTGLKRGEILSSNKLANIFTRPEGLFKGAPNKAKAIVFFNRMDLVSDQSHVEELVRSLLQNNIFTPDRIVLGSLMDDNYEFYARL